MPNWTLTKRGRHNLALLSLVLAVGCVAASMPGDSAVPRGTSPIAIERQGSFFVSGTKVHTDTGNDGDPKSVHNPGSATIHQMYVHYQIPARRKYKLPIIMVHGGGHTGAVYESTPDGRDGWATYFLRRGFAVYAVDGVNRGRSGYDITDVNLVRQGAKQNRDNPLINWYSHVRAWTQFRFGPKPGVLHPNSQFPAEAFNQYTAQLVPAWRDDAEIDRNIEGLVALLDRIGPAVVLTWSQSGLFGWRAALARPHLVKAIISCEPSMISPEGVSAGLKPTDLKALAGVPIVIEVGDYDPPRLKSVKSFATSIGANVSVLSLPDLGIYGNSHLVMIEKNNLQVADLFIQQLEKILPGNVQ
jgi:pimeloyl-ACP methyl ester carboxylesterase